MNLFGLAWSYLRTRPLNTALNAILMAFGVGIVVLLLLLSTQMGEGLTRNAQGIDMVVGAKGSPLQLVLSSIYHIDNPTGNIPLQEAEMVSRSSFVRKAIPLALGDSYQGYRIVGTDTSYASLYNAQLAEGQWFDKPMEATLGANAARLLGLEMGGSFVGQHGLMEGPGHSHDEHPYTIVGIMAPTGTVLDNLILTPVASVWLVHNHEGHDDDHEGHDHEGHDHEGHDHDHAGHEHDHDEAELPEDGIAIPIEERELTAMLLQLGPPIARIQMPRQINENTSMMAADPVYETQKVLNLLGSGVEVIRAFAVLVMLISGLSMFIGLYNSLKERRYDLAVLRALGASRAKLMGSILIEGVLTALLGAALGLLLGHGLTAWVAQTNASAAQAGFTGWRFLSAELWLVAAVLLLGVLAAVVPAMNAYRVRMAAVLAGE